MAMTKEQFDRGFERVMGVTPTGVEETQSLPDPAHVRVDGQTGQTERDAAHDVGGLATHPSQRREIDLRGGH